MLVENQILFKLSKHQLLWIVFSMFIVNTEEIPGYRITQSLGIVQGNVVRAKHIGRDLMAGLKNLVGGELRGYTELMTEARRSALERMLAQASELGADAVVNLRFSTSAITQSASELYAYGTAVKLERVSTDATDEARSGVPVPPSAPSGDE